jgi:phenylacetate-CoA ligase
MAAENGDPGVPWRGRWWAAATAGTAGPRETFIWNRSEWATVLASYARANDWAGIQAGLGRPLKVALVTSRVPTHPSAPENLAAGGDVSFRGAHAPAAQELAKAWGSAPVDVYAATETAGIASPCVYRNRHLYEDLLIVEPVDRDGNPVPRGTTGARLLVTVLFSRTLPLIRYEMSDTVRLGGRGCPCGRSFTLLEDIEGRIEDVLDMQGSAGPVRVHPIVFHHVLDQAAAGGWQVVQEPARLRVLLAGLAAGNSPQAVQAAVAGALRAAGVVGTPVDVDVVSQLERTPSGKAPYVRRLIR